MPPKASAQLPPLLSALYFPTFALLILLPGPSEDSQATNQALSTRSPALGPVHSNAGSYKMSDSLFRLWLLLKVQQGGKKTFKNTPKKLKPTLSLQHLHSAAVT